jgi:hypothetical protein
MEPLVLVASNWKDKVWKSEGEVDLGKGTVCVGGSLSRLVRKKVGHYATCHPPTAMIEDPGLSHDTPLMCHQ